MKCVCVYLVLSIVAIVYCVQQPSMLMVSELYYIGQDLHFILEPPSAPLNFVNISVTQTSIIVTWSEPDITNTDTTLTYIVEFGANGVFTENRTSIICDPACNADIFVVPNTSYSLRIYAVNMFGTGPPSDTIVVVTLPLNSRLLTLSLSTFVYTFR